MPGTTRGSWWHWATVLALILFVPAAIWWMARTAPQSTIAPVPDEGPIDRDTLRWEAVGKGLTGIKVGMARADVEAMLGAPDPMNVDAVPHDQKSYRTRYLAILEQPLPQVPNVKGFCEAVLTFDASKAGHPLIMLTCTPRTQPPSRQTTVQVV